MREGMTGDASILIAKAFLTFHRHHLRPHPGHCRRRHQRTDADYPADSCSLRGDRYAAYHADDAGGFPAPSAACSLVATGLHLAEIKMFAVVNMPARAGAGDANFRGLDAVFCLKTRAFSAMW